jgi:hypothetical protein
MRIKMVRTVRATNIERILTFTVRCVDGSVGTELPNMKKYQQIQLIKPNISLTQPSGTEPEQPLWRVPEQFPAVGGIGEQLRR